MRSNGADHVRRLVDRGVRPHRRVGHVPAARPEHLRGVPLGAPGWREGRPHDLRHLPARRRAVRGLSPLDAEARHRDGRRAGLRDERGARGRVLPVPAAKRRPDDRDARHRQLLRPHAGRPGRGRAARDRAGARVDGLPRRGRAPRSGRGPARDRLPLRRRADDGRQHQHVPVRREERRAAARPARDLHAQADLRDQRLGHAHAPVAAVGREEQLLRPGRAVAAQLRRACITSAACCGTPRAFARSPTRW